MASPLPFLVISYRKLASPMALFLEFIKKKTIMLTAEFFSSKIKRRAYVIFVCCPILFTYEKCF